MVESGGLLTHCSADSGTPGSNPGLSASLGPGRGFKMAFSVFMHLMSLFLYRDCVVCVLLRSLVPV